MDISEVRRARGRIRLSLAGVSPSTWATGGTVVALLAVCWGLTYLAGGAGLVAPHWFYAPILLGAYRFGRTGALVTAVAAAVVTGPLMPLDVAAGTPQNLTDWLSRGAFFVGMGQLMAELIARRQKAERELAAHVAALEDLDRQRLHLLARLLTAEEEERKRLAADLHDDPVQLLVAIGMRLHALRRRLSDDGLGAQVGELEEEVQACSARLRALVFELYPPELTAGGLGDAVHDLVEKFGSDTGVMARFHNGLRSQPSQAMSALAYRLVLEALSNVRKHARASRVDVEITEEDGDLAIRVQDDGLGFEVGSGEGVGPGHIGLKSMSDRAELVGGRLRVDSSPGRGTRVDIRLPHRFHAELSAV